MARYFLEVMYDGTAFNGSQIQGELPTVQLALNNALSTILREPVETFGASRTDESVHALGNYYHFDTNKDLWASFFYNLNSILPGTIAIKRIFRANDNELNARFAALTRSYRYRIYNSKDPFLLRRALYFPFRLDTELLQESARIIMNYDNFETFSKRNTQSKTFICKIYRSYWEEIGKELHYVVEANRFLRGMVRGLVGTQLQVGRGKMSIEKFREVIEARDCTLADFSVDGHGLYLEHVQYPEGVLTELFV